MTYLASEERDDPDRSREIGVYPTAARAARHAADDAPTACEIVANGGGTFRYGDEIPIDFEIVPRPVQLRGGATTVAFRFEARPRAPRHANPADERPSREDEDRFKADVARLKGRGLVIALWPYQTGVLDWIPFRTAGNKDGEKGRIARARRAKPLPDQLRHLDERKTDYLLTDSRFVTASKFLLGGFESRRIVGERWGSARSLLSRW